MEDKISTSEMVGHARKAAKLFKSFEKMGEIALLVDTHEKTVAGLKKETDKLAEEKANLDIECERVVADIDKAKADAKDIVKVVKDKLDAADETAKDIIKEAQGKAEAIVAAAKSEADSIKGTIKGLQLEEAKAANAARTAESDFQAILQKAKTMRESLISQL